METSYSWQGIYEAERLELGSSVVLDPTSLVLCGISNPLPQGDGEENSVVIFKNHSDWYLQTP